MNQMGEYVIKLVVELMICYSVPVASVCLPLLPYQEQHTLYSYLIHICSLYARLYSCARIFQQALAF